MKMLWLVALLPASPWLLHKQVKDTCMALHADRTVGLRLAVFGTEMMLYMYVALYSSHFNALVT